jgi:hypothetical protein
MKNVTMSEMTAGCDAFESAPLQVAHVQPISHKNKNKHLNIVQYLR